MSHGRQAMRLFNHLATAATLIYLTARLRSRDSKATGRHAPVCCHVATTPRSMSEWPALASPPLALSLADTARLTSQELLLGFTEISTWMLFLIGEGRLCLMECTGVSSSCTCCQ
jgi:hypothetical protein